MLSIYGKLQGNIFVCLFFFSLIFFLYNIIFLFGKLLKMSFPKELYYKYSQILYNHFYFMMWQKYMLFLSWSPRKRVEKESLSSIFLLKILH